MSSRRLLPLLAVAAFPGAFPLGGAVLGASRVHVTGPGESLIELARDNDLGFNEIAAANPALDPFVPGKGAKVTLPTAWIVPAAAAPGSLVVNLSEMRLYYVFGPGSSPAVVTFPVGIGREGFETPVGTLRVVEKRVDPPWYPPPSIRAEDPDLPAVVPPGPDNPLGSRALRLSGGRILIHGTNRPFAVGRMASHGCIRLYPEDILRLYDLVPVGTPVVIVREPVKAASEGEHVYLEVHDDPALSIDYVEEAWHALARLGLYGPFDRVKLEAAARQRSGVPTDIAP